MTLTRKLAKLGLGTVRDLLEHCPRRYKSAADEVAIAALGRRAEEVVITGEVLNVTKRPLRGRRTLVTARVSDGTVPVTATWFNQPWVADQLKPGVHVRLRGKVGKYGFDVKSYDIGEGEATADFAPVYPASEEITPKRLRTLVTHALGHVVDYFDPLPADLRDREALPLKRDALFAIHHPESEHEAEVGRQRLAFEELLLLQIGIARRAAERERTLAPSLGEPGELIERYRKALPFSFTPYQEQVVRGIDGREVGGRLALADVVRLDVEAVLANLAAQAHVHARLQLVGDPRLVEPRRGHRDGAVGDACGHERAPAAERALGDVQHLAGDHHLLGRAPERGDRDSSAADSYRRGQCSSRSRTVPRPSFASLRVSITPTPGSASSATSRRCGRGRPRVGSQAWGGSRLAKPVCRRDVGHRARRQSVSHLRGEDGRQAAGAVYAASRGLAPSARAGGRTSARAPAPPRRARQRAAETSQVGSDEERVAERQRERGEARVVEPAPALLADPPPERGTTPRGQGSASRRRRRPRSRRCFHGAANGTSAAASPKCSTGSRRTAPMWSPIIESPVHASVRCSPSNDFCRLGPSRRVLIARPSQTESVSRPNATSPAARATSHAIGSVVMTRPSRAHASARAELTERGWRAHVRDDERRDLRVRSNVVRAPRQGSRWRERWRGPRLLPRAERRP